MFDSVFKDKKSRPSLASFRRFLEALEYGSIAEASRENGVSASTYSRALKEVEKTVGSTLVKVTNGALEPTSEGKRLRAMAQTFLQGLEEFHAKGPEMITIGSGPWHMDHLVIPLLAKFRPIFSARRIKLVRMRRREDVVEAIKLGSDLDLGVFTEGGVNEDDDLFPHRVCSVIYAAVVNKSDVAASKEEIGWLKGRPLVTLHEGLADGFTGRIREKYATACQGNPDIKVYCDSYEEIMLVVKNSGIEKIVGFIAYTGTATERDLIEYMGLKIVNIIPIFHTRELIVSWNRTRINQRSLSKEMSDVFEIMREHFRSDGQSAYSKAE